MSAHTSAQALAQTFAQAFVQALVQTWRLVTRWYSIPLLLLVWQVAVGSGLVESRLLPSPAPRPGVSVSPTASATPAKPSANPIH